MSVSVHLYPFMSVYVRLCLLCAGYLCPFHVFVSVYVCLCFFMSVRVRSSRFMSVCIQFYVGLRPLTSVNVYLRLLTSVYVSLCPFMPVHGR